MSNAIQAQQKLMQAIQVYQKGDLKGAAAQLERLRDTFSNSDQVNALLGTVYFGQKRYKEAEKAFQEALKINPNNKEAMIGLGSAEKGRGRFDKSEQHFKKALKLFPNAPEIHYNLGDLYLAKEEFNDATTQFKKAFELDQNLGQALLQLINIYYHLKEYEQAEYYLQMVVDRDPTNEAILNKLNEVRMLLKKDILKAPERPLEVLEKVAEQTEPVEPEVDITSALGISSDSVKELLSLGNLFNEQGKKEKAEEMYMKVLDIDPENYLAKNGLELLVRLKIPNWHFAMLADNDRNEAFERAISKVVNKESKVLDIGTGSGLLAMMAARKGAKSVTACEVNPDIAKVAERVVAANGYQNTIKVFDKRSDFLEEGKDFHEKFDVIVSEILDAGGLGEGVLPSLRYANQHFAKPGATVIPAGISMKAKLIELPRLHKVNPIKTVSGFDLSIFDEFRVSDSYEIVNLNHEEHKSLSEVFPLRAYDFYNVPERLSFEDPEEESYTITCSEDGLLQGVAFWFDLHMDKEDTLSSGPDGELIHWQQGVYFFDEAKAVKKGDSVTITALYSDLIIRFRLP